MNPFRQIRNKPKAPAKVERATLQQIAKFFSNIKKSLKK